VVDNLVLQSQMSVRADVKLTIGQVTDRVEVTADAPMLDASTATITALATASSRDGGKQTMTDAQIEAACTEAKAQGLRAAVHAHAAGGARPAVLSGCTSIEHGTFLTDEVLDLMAERGVYLDTNLSNVHNYIEHKQAFLGLGNFTEQGFAEMAKDLPIRIDTLRRALARRVKVVFGTDAVAGLHGLNREEFVYRVRDGRQPAMDAIVSATSRAADSLGLNRQIGSIAAEMEADLVATDGNPLEDMTNVRHGSVAKMMGGRKSSHVGFGMLHFAPSPRSSLRNRINPSTSSLGNHLTWPFRIMCTTSYPWIVRRAP
jgi:imidazolonepropionase-like amidohydrolase